MSKAVTVDARAAPQHNLGFCIVNFECSRQAAMGYPFMIYTYPANLNGWSCLCSHNGKDCTAPYGQPYGCYVATPRIPGCNRGPATESNGDISTCAQCLDGYQLPTGASTSRTCWSCGASIAHCNQCSGPNVCSGCAPSYTLFPRENVCGHCAAHCQSCTASNTCDVCQAGYMPSPDKRTCYQCAIPHCASCSADNVCGVCRPGYTLSPNKLKCYECSVARCRSCSSDNVCGVCESGYVIASDGKSCVACGISNCRTCSADNVCATCMSGYTLSPDKKKCFKCDPDRCVSCSADNVCAQCRPGYVLASDGKTCVTCGISNCITCSADNVCAACNASYTLSPNKQACFSCGIKACAGCSGDAVCNSCVAGYVLSPSHDCVACTAANCEECASPGDGSTCERCVRGYKLDKKSACTKSSIPWWVWIIVGLSAALLVAILIILVCCCCCKTPPPRLHAEEERLSSQLSEDVGADERDKSKLCDSQSDTTGLSSVGWQPTELARRRNRVVSFGEELVLSDAAGDGKRLPSSYRGTGLVDVLYGSAPSDDVTFDEAEAFSLEESAVTTARNPLDPRHTVPVLPVTLRDKRRSKRRGLGVELAEVDMSEYEAGGCGIPDAMGDERLATSRRRKSGAGDANIDL